MPEKIQQAAEMYAGCVAGAIQQSEYLQLIKNNGFTDITVQKSKPIAIPGDILSRYLSQEEISAFEQSGTGIYSITVFAVKPAVQKAACCGPNCCS
ncbi:hypothetical protein EXU57_16285 [Segetibacter sp. 3557_3]|uniref:hypothetical protein n=1 Tax=Segetibacter sp. 3557_3 TaxID=2547429 RepID=UPI001058EB94|nr:hypothetical protein [Segetibacter sp. 3557_3]TDH24040.1 hypothetical protein EXU57_16285 [Segetibacter sp. 3557_3]